MHKLKLEGTLEHFTAWDALYYAGKLMFGPFRPVLPPEFNSKPPPRGPAVGDVISFTLLGDIMLNKGVLRKSSPLYANLPSLLRKCDWLFANLEFPVYPEKGPRGFPNFNGSIEYFDRVVTPLGPSCLNIANNHCLDMGPKGLESTLELLENRGISFTGVEVEGREYIKEILGDITLTIGGFTHSTNRRQIPSENRVNMFRLNSWNREMNGLDKLVELVKEMKKVGDIVILSMHWGLEFELAPTANQVAMAHTLIENGVDLIVGHHPHVLQPLEVWPGLDGAPRLIVYSLGNWISNMSRLSTRTTAAVKVWLDRAGRLKGVCTFPFYFCKKSLTLLPLKGEERGFKKYIPQSFRECMV